MLTWIVRILLILAAPIAALLVARDTLQFGLVQTFVAMILLIVVLGLVAVWTTRGRGTRS